MSYPCSVTNIGRRSWLTTGHISTASTPKWTCTSCASIPRNALSSARRHREDAHLGAMRINALTIRVSVVFTTRPSSGSVFLAIRRPTSIGSHRLRADVCSRMNVSDGGSSSLRKTMTLRRVLVKFRLGSRSSGRTSDMADRDDIFVARTRHRRSQRGTRIREVHSAFKNMQLMLGREHR